MTAGYSGTPLGKKLGYREAMRVFVDGMPDLIRHDIEKSIGEKPDWHFIPEPELPPSTSLSRPGRSLRTKFRP